jgi:hypothetical protein
VGCSVSEDDTNNSETPLESPKPSQEVIKPVNVSSLRIVFSTDFMGRDYSEEEISDWENYMYEKYGQVVDLIPIGPLVYKRNGKLDTSQIADEAGKGGFLYVPSRENLVELIDTGLIVPVNEIIDNVEFYKTMENDIIDGFSHDKGLVWGLPLGDYMLERTNHRHYNHDVLKKAGMDAPETIDDFKELAMFLLDNDENNDGMPDTYLAEYRSNISFMGFEDILAAYGCYTDVTSLFAYNPEKGIYEICAFNENFNDAMGFVKYLKDNDLLIDTFIEHDFDSNEILKISPDQFVTASTRYPSKEYDSEGWVKKNYLMGIQTESLIEAEPYSSCFAVLNGTGNPGELAQNFITLLESDPNSCADFYFGAEGISYVEHEDYLELLDGDNGISSKQKILGIRIVYKSLGFGEKPWISTSTTYEERSEGLSWYENNVEQPGEVPDELLYSRNLNQIHPDYQKIRTGVLKESKELFVDIMENNIPIEDAVESFRIRLEDLDIFDAIDEMNNDILN